MKNKDFLHVNTNIAKSSAIKPKLANKKALSLLTLETYQERKIFPKSAKICHDPADGSHLYPQKPKTSRLVPKELIKNDFCPSQIISSIKENGLIDGFAATTDQGLFRDYNEDRVSIILNVNKPLDRAQEIWPKCSFFAVYDGHGGSACCDFLRDNLHQFITRNQFFPQNPKEALLQGFAQAESTFLQFARSMNPIDTSGSCAIVILIVSDVCYVANLGDSRAVMSGDNGKKVYPLSKDHKPGNLSEKQRIENSGGRVYQTWHTIDQQKFQGPDRILPGRLSVSRSFGDAEAKLVEFGGKPEVLSSIPDIKVFKLLPEHDFIVLACDGIFDKLSNKDVVQSVNKEITQWSLDRGDDDLDVHRMCSVGAETIMKAAVKEKTMDNITVVVIGLNGLARKVKNFTQSLVKEVHSKIE